MDEQSGNVASRLWRRRKHLVLLLLLFAVFQSASAALAFLVPPWKAIIEPYGGLTSLASQLPRLDVVFLALLFCFYWFRLCLRDRAQESGQSGASRSLRRRAVRAGRFLAFAGALTILASLVFLGGSVAIRLALDARLETIGANPEMALAIYQLSGHTAGLLVPFLSVLVPLLPVAALAPLFMRAAMILPAIADGHVPQMSRCWIEARGAWKTSTAILTVLMLAIVLALPSGRLTYLAISALGGPAWTLLLLLWIPAVIDLVKAILVAAILADLLTIRYLGGSARRIGDAELETGPQLRGRA